MTIQRSKVMFWALRFYVYTIIVKVTRKNSTLGRYEQIQPQGPVPWKMVNFNPGLSQISSKVFFPKNTSLQLTKCCCVFTLRFSDDNIKCYSLSKYAQEGKNKKRNKIIKSWISPYRPFRNPGPELEHWSS